MSDADILPADDEAVYKTLLESTRAIPWRIDWDSKRFTYIGPQIGPLLGWPPESWHTVEDWAERMHPDDREWVVNFCVSQSASGLDHEADYRALTAAGEYIWIRDVVHVVRRHDGSVEALVGFMFDISDRKKTEEQLASLQKELEELSYKDALTGVANRRMFDSVMDMEWSQSLRLQQPLSLLFLDIDFFKDYNDHYGHVQGDECLRSVTSLLAGAATRARDFFARYGGEEFVWVLPETDASAARLIAERCRQRVLQAQIPHSRSRVGKWLTISLGVGTAIPARGDEALDFIEAVDRRLYQAKQRGRNCIASAD